jgi:hypothetical protein
MNFIKIKKLMKKIILYLLGIYLIVILYNFIINGELRRKQLTTFVNMIRSQLEIDKRIEKKIYLTQGQALSNEKPDMSRKDAEQLVDQYLKQGEDKKEEQGQIPQKETMAPQSVVPQEVKQEEQGNKQ